MLENCEKGKARMNVGKISSNKKNSNERDTDLRNKEEVSCSTRKEIIMTVKQNILR